MGCTSIVSSIEAIACSQMATISRFLVYFLFYTIHSYSQWRAWVGLRDVVFDYVQPARLRPQLAGVLAFGLAALGVWLVWILLQAQA